MAKFVRHNIDFTEKVIFFKFSLVPLHFNRNLLPKVNQAEFFLPYNDSSGSVHGETLNIISAFSSLSTKPHRFSAISRDTG